MTIPSQQATGADTFSIKRRKLDMDAIALVPSKDAADQMEITKAKEEALTKNVERCTLENTLRPDSQAVTLSCGTTDVKDEHHRHAEVTPATIEPNCQSLGPPGNDVVYPGSASAEDQNEHNLHPASLTTSHRSTDAHQNCGLLSTVVKTALPTIFSEISIIKERNAAEPPSQILPFPPRLPTPRSLSPPRQNAKGILDNVALRLQLQASSCTQVKLLKPVRPLLVGPRLAKWFKDITVKPLIENDYNKPRRGRKLITTTPLTEPSNEWSFVGRTIR
ncbi:hypothetical protein K439DRAFT_783137 [Ramaria rubella]|nr:hypothetical protein K439DRAFT_783137 [Ramaria rubella]